MFRRFLFTALLSTSLAAVGQAVSNGTSPSNGIPPGPGLQGNGGYVIGPNGNGQVAASTVAFASPSTTAGVSEAGLAGISDHAPLQQGVQSTLGPSTLVTTSAPPTVSYASQPSATSGTVSERTTESSVSDLGSSFYAGPSNAGGAMSSMNPSLSLGEVAVQNKIRNGALHARSYTNTDVQNLISRRGGGNIMEAANRAPSGVPAPTQDAQETTSSGQNVGQPANSSIAQSKPAAQADNGGLGQAVPASQTQQKAETNSAGNTSTTPQIRQTQHNDTQENNQQLPATSTILPLLGLIGLASSGVGLWYRKSHK